MGAVFNPEEVVKNLTDAYFKRKDGNNYKILEIEHAEVEKIRSRIKDIDDITDLNNARGKTLDLYGERVGQERGNATDEKYIMLIKAKILRNLANGSYNSIVRSLGATFNCEPSLFTIMDAEEGATVTLFSLPLSVINNAGLNAEQTISIIKSLLPAGIAIETIVLEGSFEFAASADVYDADKGFGSVDQTIGGTLGYLSNDNTDIPV